MKTIHDNKFLPFASLQPLVCFHRAAEHAHSSGPSGSAQLSVETENCWFHFLDSYMQQEVTAKH